MPEMTVAVGDHLIVGRGIGYQQRLGAELAAPGLDAERELIKPLPPFDPSLLPGAGA